MFFSHLDQCISFWEKVEKKYPLFKKVRTFPRCPFFWVHTGCLRGLFWAETHPPSKCLWNLFVILDKCSWQTRRKHNVLCRVNNCSGQFYIAKVKILKIRYRRMKAHFQESLKLLFESKEYPHDHASHHFQNIRLSDSNLPFLTCMLGFLVLIQQGNLRLSQS